MDTSYDVFLSKNENLSSAEERSGKAGENDEKQGPSLIHGDSMGADEASRLKDLATDVRNQDDLERDVNRQADQLLAEQADERDQKRIEKTKADKNKLQNQIHRLIERRGHSTGSATNLRLTSEISRLEAQVQDLNTDLLQIQERIDLRNGANVQGSEPASGEDYGGRLPNESQRDFLIRTGKITPFSKLPGRSLDRSESTLQDVLLDAEEEHSEIEEAPKPPKAAENLSHRNLLQPGFNDIDGGEIPSGIQDDEKRPRKRPRLHKRESVVEDSLYAEHEAPIHPQKEGLQASDEDSDAFLPENEAKVQDSASEESGSDYDEEDDAMRGSTPQRPGTRSRQPQHFIANGRKEDFAGLDDGNEHLYQNRLKSWVDRRSTARANASSNIENLRDQESGIVHQVEDVDDADSGGHEWHMPHPVKPDTVYEGGFRIPGDIYPSLFDYQKTGVQWLWELYSQQVGGIVGDEMGLGKTIQIISFLAGLHYSKKITKPTIVIAPATVMKQWVNEFHSWWPPFRVSILHTSGSGMMDIGHEAQVEDELLTRLPGSSVKKPLSKAQKLAKKIVGRVAQEGHILVTTYSGLQTYADLLIPMDWEYAILDEGHKIRNPNTAITIYCKELRTANRIILSGTPMQNNLVELWSLFDFIFPMRLGTLVNFRQQFEFPIRQGGYANASNLQVQTAMKCAETLKDTISPYLLQRFKADVASDLPKKSEQVLFCKLTKFQRESYENFLDSDELKAIMNGKRQILFGVDILRKICNHPDLVDHKTLSIKPGYNYGSGAKSGKMQVVKALLELWKEQGHKTLVFAQHRIMLDILEKFINLMGGFNHRRMDGTTPIQTRQNLVDEFNNNPSAHVFLLTTKVGGLGINLTGANRVIIYDPDWNPSTDIQARERAWRLGQKREVMIYRLMTAGAIEEKIYHRQLFKQFLINKILRDPKQRQTFQMKDLHDLFTLGGSNDPATETGDLFKGTEVRFGGGDVTAEPNCVEKVTNSEYNSSSVSNLTGVDSMERFDDGKVERASSGNDTSKSEASVMEGIFARSGVHAALEHDQIVNGRKVVSADPKMIEKEAKRVAAEAATELRKAGEAARNIPIGTPTWTGQYGIAGRPEQQQRVAGRGRGGPSSSSILAGLQNRQGANGFGGGSRSSTPGSTGSGPRGIDFMKLIRDYLITHGGQVHTQMLIDHFNRHCNTPAKTVEFKAMLKEMATLDKGSRARGRWVLKEEYASKRTPGI